MEDFERAWIRFDLVAAAKKWDNAKQLAIVPALLRGKLVDFFVELSEEECADMQTLKKALSAKAGLARDPLSSAKCFNMRKQGQEEKVADFARDLKKLFTQAYPSESIQSPVLLQRFLTGLLGSVSQQLLLKGRPANLEQAIKEATEVEYALHFSRETAEVHAVQQSTSDKRLDQLTQTMEKMALQLEKLEAKLQVESQRLPTPAISDNRGQGRGNRRNQRRSNCCFQCGEEGHFRRECPLNFREPARKVPGGWQDKQ